MPVLIINNDDDFLTELQYAFQMRGCTVISTHNNLIATRLFIQYRPRIVIFNIFMPEKDGFEIVKEIRMICKKTILLAISSNSLYLRSITKLGANLALPRGINLTTMLYIIQFLEQKYKLH